MAAAQQTAARSSRLPLPSHSAATQSNPSRLDSSITTPGSTTGKKRSKAHVNLLRERYKATQWMIEKAEEQGEERIISKVVKAFPQYFTGNMKANLQKASRWWRKRDETMLLQQPGHRRGLVSGVTHAGGNRANFKAVCGRGRKRAPWVHALYKDLFEEFERLRAAGSKISASVLRSQALDMIKNASPDCIYHESTQSGSTLSSRITFRWIQRFMECNRIVKGPQTGKLMISGEEELQSSESE